MVEAWAVEPAVGAAAVAARLIADARLWGEDLMKLGKLGTEALAAFETIERRGVRAALEDRLAAVGA
jgi:hypothetical protein